jgi:L-threonylcarbamoyladenylate synthase
MNIEKIQIAAQIINKGGLVAFPTETVYGLGANALNPIAVAKIFALKERPSFDPLIVHIASTDELNILTSESTELVLKLAEKFWPGPLTIVLPKSSLVHDIVTSGLPTVAIRMPDNEIALNLIRTSKCPIAAPSANKFGNLSPVSASHVKKQLPKVDFILDGGKTKIGIESTIVSLDGNVCTMLRPGKISIKDIEDALPGVFVFNIHKQEKLIAPGLLKSHYSPKKPLYLLKTMQTQLPDNSGLILHRINNEKPICKKVIYTSLNNNLPEIAANLFSSLHSMEDDAEIKQIFIEPVIEKEIGIAIMDRIKKAVYKYESNE